MALFSKTEEEKAAKADSARLKAEAKASEEFTNSPQGQARAAFERGDEVFQCAIDLQKTQAVVSMLMGGQTYTRSSNDPGEILNSISREGWELINGSFVFVETGSETRDKLLSSGQNVATRGTIVGYYLFRRKLT